MSMMRVYILSELSLTLRKYVGRENSSKLRTELADEIVDILGRGVEMFPSYSAQDMWDEISSNEEFLELMKDAKETFH